MRGKDIGKQKNNSRTADQIVLELECSSQSWGLREGLNQEKAVIL